MSNQNILNRLEIKLKQYELGECEKFEFTTYLESSIQALEKLQDSTIEQSREFSYKFVVTEFADELPEDKIDKVLIDFRDWLKELKENYT